MKVSQADTLNFMKDKQIQVFVRHCNSSSNSTNKIRPQGFSKELCHENLKRTINPQLANITFLMDGDLSKHFLSKERDYPIIPIQGGSEAASFLAQLNYIESLGLDDETIVYLLEDDFFHRSNWCELIREVFDSLNADYVTLYDHKDKYFYKMYEKLKSQIFHTNTCHWRTVPSTTSTFMCKWKVLKKHIHIHKRFCQRSVYSHEKFIKLGKMGATLISPIPGWSTHMETEFLSPTIDWEALLLKESQLAGCYA